MLPASNIVQTPSFYTSGTESPSPVAFAPQRAQSASGGFASAQIESAAYSLDLSQNALARSASQPTQQNILRFPDLPGANLLKGIPAKPETQMPTVVDDTFSPDQSAKDPSHSGHECNTCDSRRYLDGSNDSSVSFQVPTKLDPATAKFAVKSHESEHVRNERADAKTNDRKIISQTVSIRHSVCPECGDPFIKGGVTRTVSARNVSAQQAEQAYKATRDAAQPQQHSH